MKLGMQGISLALVAAGMVVTPIAAVAAQPDSSAIDQLRADADKTVTLKKEGATGQIGFVSTKGDLMPDVAADGKSKAAAKARKYLDKYAPVFGAEADQLDQSKVTTNPSGWTVEFKQEYEGVPVFGGVLKAHVDKAGDLTSVNGFAAPSLDLGTTPKWSKEKASAKALDLVKAKPADAHADSQVNTLGVEVVEADLNVYRMGAAQGVSGKSLLAWVIEVSNKSTVRETVVLDAANGKPVNRYSMIHSANERELIEKHNTPDTADDATVWVENDAFPGTLDQDQQNEVATTGESYWLFQNTFGRDSYDGSGAKMVTVNNDPGISCPNANWNGATTNYCSGVTSDDVVAHEWGHAYTEHTSGLIYQWQSGALNEAYSDMWGNAVDFLNTRENTTDDVIRSDDACSTSSPARVKFEITAPEDIAGLCQVASASWTAPDAFATPVNASIVVARDAANTEGPSETDGCTAYSNAADVAGKWAYVDRGTCPFQIKADNAVAAGAAGLVVGNNTAAAPNPMSGTSTIPGVMIDMAHGEKLRTAGSATATISQTANTAESERWLVGEDSTAFGGAIRDMWNPTCYGDPGKVSDEEYHCDTSDAGGVHSNSGVINHHFALLVDGGAYNDVTVPSIGLDKAANLIWHTQTNYLTPTSGFPEYAQAMVTSCADLAGATNLKKLTLGTSTPQSGGGVTPGGAAEAPALEPITAADCAAVAAANTATELADEPVQCNFGPLLDQDTPAICGEGTNEVSTYTETFEDGLTGWSQDAEAWNGGNGFPWEARSDIEGNETGVAWGPDPADLGSCGGRNDPDDLTSRNGLISPEITVPAGQTPRLTFDHSVRTEAGWDGGNVKVSVNGGDFALVDQAAYLFNAPAGALGDGSGFLEGQPVWTGTDGGEFTGEWGTTIVDLDAVADAGDTVKFRFDMGRDGCNGVEGWAIDNVSVSYCTEKAVPEITAESPKKGKVEITVDGERASGEIVVTENGKRIGRFGLKKDETATFRASRGEHTYQVAYSGDRKNEAITETVTVRVK
ncbi:M4 family metallopeptidase [Nocardioides panzhihuensis]|uniref:Zn-dependent metalloprotease n=1 Tax=Nocardioides panzhihuensis TaxID=860243 RepID=A0A7Z0IUC1_9ACTN|nr:Zn-dependent metalloprotease [Nocardioides panzhihuensis]